MFEGRPLARPDEEIVDQGLAFDVGTVLRRRQVLQALGLGVTAFGLAACTPSPSGSVASGTSTTSTDEIPEETAGPYPADGSNGPDVLDKTGIVRSDIRSSFAGLTGTAGGVPMTLELTVRNLADGGQPFTGAAVYVWHCDREGRYSLYTDGASEQNYLRGVQLADASGTVRFTSVFPACYGGRWPHVHFEVYRNQAGITDAGQAIVTSQLALPKNVCDTVYAQAGYEASVPNLSRVTLAGDMVFGNDDGVRQIATVTGDVSTGYGVSLDVPVKP